MSTSLGFSAFTNMEEPMKNKRTGRTNHRKTIKKRSGASNRSNKVKEFLNSMNNKEKFGVRASNDRSSGAGTMGSIDDEMEDVSSEIGDESSTFGEPYVSSNYKPVTKDAGKADNTDKLMSTEYNPRDLEGFGLLKEGLEQQQKYHNDQQQYYNQYVPTYTGTSNNVPYYSQLSNSQNLSGPKDELMRKLNYVVHMLEEQSDEKTANVTEELVLYMFLGVFVIFVVDSFARVGKYTR